MSGPAVLARPLIRFRRLSSSSDVFRHLLSAATTPVASGVYTLASGSSGKCVDVPSSSTTSGTQLQQYSCGDPLRPPRV
jgi:ricin-type beta-trefoil lectin protein